MLLGTDKDGTTAWHCAARWGNSEILIKVLEWAKQNLTKEEINNKLLLGTDEDGITAWHYAAWRGNSEILQKLWVWAKENLTREEINNKLFLSTEKMEQPLGTTQQRRSIQRFYKGYGSGLKRI